VRLRCGGHRGGVVGSGGVVRVITVVVVEWGWGKRWNLVKFCEVTLCNTYCKRTVSELCSRGTGTRVHCQLMMMTAIHQPVVQRWQQPYPHHCPRCCRVWPAGVLNLQMYPKVEMVKAREMISKNCTVPMLYINPPGRNCLGSSLLSVTSIFELKLGQVGYCYTESGWSRVR